MYIVNMSIGVALAVCVIGIMVWVIIAVLILTADLAGVRLPANGRKMIHALRWPAAVTGALTLLWAASNQLFR
jgi:hypothetical protein